MKLKESTTAGLHLNVKKTKIITTEGIQNSNKDNEDLQKAYTTLTQTKISKLLQKDFAYLGSLINSNGRLQPKNEEKAETQKGSKGRN